MVDRELRLSSAFFRHAERYGFQRVFVSPVSLYETFEPSARIASDWSYHFPDKAGRELILNPDSLPALCRLYSSVARTKAMSVRWSFCAPIFRYKRVKQRHYHHLGATCFNEEPEYFDNLIADLMIDFLQSEFPERPFALKINDFALWNQVLRLAGISDENIEAIFSVPHAQELLSVLDAGTVSNIHRVSLKRTVQRLVSLGPVSITSNGFTSLKRALPSVAYDRLHYVWEYALARQRDERFTVVLDLGDFHAATHYSGLAFQIYTDLHKPRLGDGGAYHSLGQRFHPAIHTVFSTILRFEDAASLYDAGQVTAALPTLYLYVMPAARPSCLQLVGELRRSGISVWEDLRSRTVGAAIKLASEAGVPFFAVLGDSELETRQIELRHLVSRSTTVVSWEDAAQHLRNFRQ